MKMEAGKKWKIGHDSYGSYDLQIEPGIKITAFARIQSGERCYLFAMNMGSNGSLVVYDPSRDEISVDPSLEDMGPLLRYRHLVSDVPGLPDQTRAGLESLFGRLEEEMEKVH